MANYTIIATTAIVIDTFQEAFARKIFWGLFGLSTLTIAFFLFIMKIDIVEGGVAAVSLFGNQAGREVDVQRMVKTVEAGIASFLYTTGLFLAVFASAGLIPSVLEPGRIELLLSKPVSRLHLLLGRYLGNLIIVGANAVYLVFGVWIILGIKTGIWGAAFLSSILTTIFLFSVMLTVVILIGVTLESTALAVMIPTGLMIISPLLAQHERVVKLLSSETSRAIWMALYNVLPKVYDVGKMTVDIIFNREVQSFAPVWSSAAFGVAVMAVAIYLFQRRDF